MPSSFRAIQAVCESMAHLLHTHDEASVDARVAELAAEVEAALTTEDGRREALVRSRRFLFWMNDGSILPHDEAMLSRIARMLDSGEMLTEPDRVFLIHEWVEDAMLREYQPNPHYALRRRFGDFANYAPDVVKQYAKSYFNEAWLEHWNLK